MFKWDSVQFSCSVMSDSLQPHELQHARPPYPSPTPGVHPNSCPLSQWCHPAISSSVVPFSSCPQSFPASGSFQVSKLQYHSSKESILCHSAFFMAHPYMATGKTIALTRWAFVGKIMSLLLNMLSRLVITFLPRNKCLLISWLQSPSAVILEPPKLKSATVSPSICHELMGLDAMILVFWLLSFNEINNFNSIGILWESLSSFKCTCFINARISFLNFIIYFLLCWVFLAALGFSLVVQNGYSSHIAWASHCSGFSCCRAWALSSWASAVAAPRLQSTGSVVATHGLSCSTACGTFSDQELNPCVLHWQTDSLPLSHQRRPVDFLTSMIWLCLTYKIYLKWKNPFW